MRRGERRSHGGALGKAALEEQPDGGVMEAPPGSRGDSPPAAPDSAAPGLRRSTESEVYDDGTNTFFWRAHTLTVLFILTCALGYVTLLEETPQDTAYNTKSYSVKKQPGKRAYVITPRRMRSSAVSKYKPFIKR